jgi:hypothetical protein
VLIIFLRVKYILTIAWHSEDLIKGFDLPLSEAHPLGLLLLRQFSDPLLCGFAGFLNSFYEEGESWRR